MATVQEILFNDGEGLDYGDLNNLQRYLRSQIWDSVVGAQSRTAEYAAGGSSTDLFAVGPGGAPYPSATARTMSIEIGTVAMGNLGTGTDAGFKAYRIASGELAPQHADNATGSDVWDIYQVKLEHIDNDAADNETRDFEDATTHVLTSTSMVKKRKVRLTASIKRGTPGSGTEPAVDAGYVKLYAVLVPNGIGAGVLLPANVRDYRIPIGYKVIDVPAAMALDRVNWTDATVGQIFTTTNGAIARIYPPAIGGYASHRLVGIGLQYRRTAADAMTVELTRADVAADITLTETQIRDLSASFPVNAPATEQRYREVSLYSGTPIWANGQAAGFAYHGRSFSIPATDLPTLVLKVTAGDTNLKNLWRVRFIFAGGL